jgi:malonyl-CoA O-methyltransferase
MNNEKKQRDFDRLAEDYDRCAVLMQHAGEQMLQRLSLVELQPAVVLDLGGGTGLFNGALHQHFPAAELMTVDASSHMLAKNKASNKFQARAESLSFANNSIDLIFSNMLLPFCDDIQLVFSECRRVLKPNGLLFFSSFGPNNELPDMHDVGDSLINTGFVDPVMEVEHLSLAYSSIDNMQQEMSGAGLMDFVKPDDSKPAFEIVYGHAWCSDKQTSKMNDAGEAFFSVDSLRKR